MVLCVSAKATAGRVRFEAEFDSQCVRRFDGPLSRGIRSRGVRECPAGLLVLRVLLLLLISS
jgi:hypothetical protein